MTYEEFKALPSDVIARLKELKMPKDYEDLAAIMQHRDKVNTYDLLYYRAVAAERKREFDFTPAPKSKPVKPVRSKVEFGKEKTVDLPISDPSPVIRGEVEDDGEES